jgi:hypothetical protein
LFVHGPDDSDVQAQSVCVQGLRSLERQRSIRARNCELVGARLDSGVHRVVFNPAEMCWRLPVLMADHGEQIEVISRLRSRGILVSNHYFPASFLGVEGLTAARRIGLGAINLFVDGRSTTEELKMACECISEVAAKRASGRAGAIEAGAS